MCLITLHFSRVRRRSSMWQRRQKELSCHLERLVVTPECCFLSVGDAAHASHSRGAAQRRLSESLP